MNAYQEVIQKIDRFIRKYYKNEIIKGGLIALAMLLGIFLIFAVSEYLGNFGKSVRTFLFFSFLLFSLGIAIFFFIIPLFKLYRLGNTLSYEEAAKIIGTHFKPIEDRLLNILQLKNQSQESELILASIEQKSNGLHPFDFREAIEIKKNITTYAKYALIPISILSIIWLVKPQVISSSSSRIINYSNTYIPPLPYSIELISKNLVTKKNQNFELIVKLNGNQIPQEIFIGVGENTYPLKQIDQELFTYNFSNVQNTIPFTIQTKKNELGSYILNVIANPKLSGLSISLDYPKYLLKENEKGLNNGNIVVPEGTNIKWDIHTKDAEKLEFTYNDSLALFALNKNVINITKNAVKNQQYTIALLNDTVTQSTNYLLQVVKDQFPKIRITKDTSGSLMTFKGNIEDDYGFKSLAFIYQARENNQLVKKRIPVSINKNMPIQSFDFSINFQSIEKNFPGQHISYFFEVWDNDGVNGSKSSKSQTFTFHADSKAEQKEKLTAEKNNIKNSLKENMKDIESLNKDLESLKKEIVDKKELDWNSKEKIDQLLNKFKKVEKNIENASELNKSNQEKSNEQNELEQEIVDKQEQLQKLFDELLTDELKEQFKKLEELRNKLDKNTLQKELDNIEMSTEDLNKSLERQLELFKQLEMDQKIDDLQEKFKSLEKEQKKLSEETKKSGNKENEQLKKKQDDLNQKMDELSKELNKMDSLNNQLENKRDNEKTSQLEKSIQQDMKDSKESLEKKDNKKASEQQENAGEKMQEMQEALSQMKSQESENQENIDDLRALLEKLLIVSFDQEALITELKNVNSRSPIYNQKTQDQQVIREKMTIIKDSLFALSKRVIQLEHTINKEVATIDNNMQQATEMMAQRKTPIARSKQQFAMTSINNLALLLDESIQQMQSQMRQQKQGKGSCDKPGGKGKSKPSAGNMKKMQQQLNQQIQKLEQALKEGKKPGGQKGNSGMTKQMAKLAAEQAKLRHELQQLMNSKEGSGAEMRKISKLMDKTETDLLNKRITQQTLSRQQEILTRLLESEKADREREFDKKRESKEGINKLSNTDKVVIINNKKNSNSIDILNTISPNFKLFYQNKVSSYFQNKSK